MVTHRGKLWLTFLLCTADSHLNLPLKLSILKAILHVSWGGLLFEKNRTKASPSPPQKTQVPFTELVSHSIRYWP